MYKMLIVCGVLIAGLLSQPLLSQPQDSSSGKELDYEVFKAKIEPIFLNKRPGHARCYVCHSSNNAPLRMVPLSAGETFWSEEESRKNFDLVKRVAIAGDLTSPILTHPLAESAGGDFFHSGGKHFESKDNPEWKTLRDWIMGESK